jgi:TRAP-type transport system periplasmic protein
VTRSRLLVFLALFGAALSGAASSATSASDVQAAKPVVLTLLTVDDRWASEFSAAVARLSDGGIRIDVRVGGGWNLDYERVLTGKVRAGDADLVSVGARAWDRMGVTRFQPLVAPLLVRSLDHERRVLAAPGVIRMLASLEPLGLVGLAVLPGPLRRPYGITRPLLGPQDYAGAKIGIRYGRVAQDTVHALGATPKGYRIDGLVGVDGAELDPTTIAGNSYDVRGASLTANVVLWARPETIAIGRAAFDRLTGAQQRILRRAGSAAAAPVYARLVREQRDSTAELCRRGRLVLATASAAQTVALQARVAPILAGLERDATTRSLVARIRAAGKAGMPDVLRCPEGSQP